MICFLVTLVGISLVLSFFDRPPMAVSALVFESDGEDSVASRRLNNPDASRFEISARGDTR